MLPTDPNTSRSRGSVASATVAWLVILACVGYTLWELNRPEPAPPKPPTGEAAPASDDHPLQEPLENAARIILAISEWFSPQLRPMFLSQAELLKTEGPKERMVYAIMAADLVGPEEARKELDAIAAGAERDKWVARSTTDLRLLEILDRLYAAPEATSGTGAAPTLSNEDRAFLEKELRWFGRLAPVARGLAGGTPERAAMMARSRIAPLVIMGFVLWMLLCGGVGLVALIVLVVRAIRGTLQHGFGEVTGCGRVYAEAFAVFMGVFTLIHVLRDLLGTRLDAWPPAVVISLSIFMQVAGFGGALGWAVMRVGSWQAVRRDIGWHSGRGFAREFLAGVLTYCTAVPLLVLGLLMTLVLLGVQKLISPDAPLPSHPAQEMLKNASVGAAIQIFFLGVVVAPIIEETAFRGLLYRHLRESTAKWRLALSMTFAAGVSSLLFAAIHPQGWPVIPALASLAVAFCIAREWRGSLIPSMVAHGISNLVMLTVGMTLFRG